MACGDKDAVEDLSSTLMVNVDSLKRSQLPKNVLFSHLPTDISAMDFFGAIGGIYFIPKAHGGFVLRDYFQATAEIPVYAMSEGIIYNIRYGTDIYPERNVDPQLVGQEYKDYALHIYLTPTAEMHYGHIGRLAPEIADQAELIKGSTENATCITVSAGQVLGYIGIHPGFDVGYSESRDLPYFANPTRYDTHYMGSQPFTDKLPPELRAQIWEINPRTHEPRGGRVNYDVAGTLAGNWFLLGTATLDHWARQLIFGYHETFADKITIAETSPTNEETEGDDAPPHLWWVFGNKPIPEEVTLATGKVKYNVATWYKFYNDAPPSEGVVMVELSADDKLIFEFFEGLSLEQVEDFINPSFYER